MHKYLEFCWAGACHHFAFCLYASHRKGIQKSDSAIEYFNERIAYAEVSMFLSLFLCASVDLCRQLFDSALYMCELKANIGK